MVRKAIIPCLIFALILLTACAGPKEREAKSVLDTPEYHYNQGKRFLEKDILLKFSQRLGGRGLELYRMPTQSSLVVHNP